MDKAQDLYNCTRRCVPLFYESIMDTIDHGIPKCMDPIEKDEYCMLGVKGGAIARSLQNTCSKQCKNKGL